MASPVISASVSTPSRILSPEEEKEPDVSLRSGLSATVSTSPFMPISPKPVTPFSGSKRKLIYTEDKENHDESPTKKSKLLDLDSKDPCSASKVKNETQCNHTPQWLRLRMSSKCTLEERREKLREYRTSLHLDLRSSRLESCNMKHLEAKDEIIDKLKMRICELESRIDGTTNNGTEESLGLQKLLQQLQQAQEENCQLVSKVTEMEISDMKSKGKCRVLNDEIRDLKRQNESNSEKLASKIFLLEKDVSLLKEDKAKQDERIKELKDQNAKLKAEIFDKSVKERTLEKQIQATKVMLEEEKNRQFQINKNALQLLEEKLRTLQTSYTAVRQNMGHLSLSMNDLVHSTSLKVQDVIRETTQTNQDLVKRYAKEIKLRKRYHNQLVELRGNIRVFCRVRPCHNRDQCLSFDSHDDGIIRVNHKGRNQAFEFDKVFNANIKQSQMFEEVSDLVRSVLDGFNVCIFAYGQTGSGKTYTMEGPIHDPGINQRALQFLYQQVQALSWNYTIQVSVLEVYNETIRDLLKPDPNAKLEVKLKTDGSLNVPGLVKVPIASLEEANRVIQMGRENRAIAATNMNEHSSRSHCLLCISVNGVNALTGDKCFGQLNLVDLAGSERVSKSMAEGPRLKEAQSINKSLAALGDVINALKNKHSHVPYRNSKLTYLLQDSLGGDSKTLMILQASPEEVNISETVCTLTFGQRVRSAELGAASRRIEEGHKSTPSSIRHAANNETPCASPKSINSGRCGANQKSQSTVKRKL